MRRSRRAGSNLHEKLLEAVTLPPQPAPWQQESPSSWLPPGDWPAPPPPPPPHPPRGPWPWAVGRPHRRAAFCELRLAPSSPLTHAHLCAGGPLPPVSPLRLATAPSPSPVQSPRRCGKVLCSASPAARGWGRPWKAGRCPWKRPPAEGALLGQEMSGHRGRVAAGGPAAESTQRRVIGGHSRVLQRNKRQGPH